MGIYMQIFANRDEWTPPVSHTMSKPAIFSIVTLFCTILILVGCKSQRTAQSPSDGPQSSTILPKDFTAQEADKLLADEAKADSGRNVSPNYEIRSTELGHDIDQFLKNSPVFSSHFTGFSLYDLAADEFLVNHHADMYFTPASNVKILTLYAVLRSFGKQLPTALYYDASDTLYIRPIGDPTFLHPDFRTQPLQSMLRNTLKPVVILWPQAELPSFGIGWMWDDYNTGYQPELSWMPIYGNVARFSYTRSKITAVPPLFEDLIEVTKGNGNENTNTIRRAFGYNHFEAEIRYPNWSFEKSIPFKYSESLAAQLLKEQTINTVSIKTDRKLRFDTLYTMPIDTVLRLMMQESDNLLSEQLLIMAAWKNGFDNSEAFREYMTARWLPDIDPVWMDGSGLSRYNLIRPVDKVKLLTKLYHEFGWARIHNLFAHGGVSGTLKNWYPNRPDPNNPEAPVVPYVIAKTGTLANNHSLSGYLQTRSGKLLVFSFMNNNFVRSTSEVRREMQTLLEKIRDAY